MERAAAGGKGTVTPFASMFPANEAQKAAKRVEEKIGEKQKELDCIKEFVTENTNLINLVSRLPDELNHDIMVPFGKAAFFPGRLIHTNEFMVLLGDGYYAERTAKQTVEILARRGKALDSQIESLMANMKDLKAEASFFDVTASEAAEGLVEIREDYVEENSREKHSKSDDKNNDEKVASEDDEYARIMSRLDELEKEELEAEDEEADAEDDDESAVEQPDAAENNDESDMDENHDNTQPKAKFNQFPHQIHSEIRKPLQQTTAEALSNKYLPQQSITDTSNVLMQTPKSGFNSSKAFTCSIAESAETVSRNSGQQAVTSSQASEPAFDSSKAIIGSTVERADIIPKNSQQQAATSSQASKPAFDSSKAFTGSVVERTYNLPTSGQDAISSQSSSSQPSKPVSRFKMRRS
ncbi:PREDICTED: RNA polymerase II subunit 5-mediating protein homolog isoform X2 [Populus euphratica]|uniref:RNA polymerase II subunit 5-mediating protein homolog isoform X2 n=1 Tax=Populus euphratica TaxID=75702 RepID=A0AAJ6XRX1_POPEU|nr:PREDICTED: RNA polymerase II subunit 5-mediating protein homolog isoform X2 [Populus euphratica]